MLMKVCQRCQHPTESGAAACPRCQHDLGSAPEVGSGELAGAILDRRYQLERVVGEGSMGWVYEARHRALDRRVAIKLLKDAQRSDDRRIQRFEREAQAVSRLHHPHIVAITDFGRTDAGLLYLVTEFVEGPTLNAWQAQSPAPELSRALALFQQVLSAMEEAHAARVIHRDLKPENVMVIHLRSGHEYAKVLDFGIALLADRDRSQIKLTRSGMVVGTPGYISPEQASGVEGDERADIYALGCMLHELLTGRVPFEHSSAMAVMVRRLRETPPPPSQVAPERKIPPALDAVVVRALRREPDARYASVAAFRLALSEAVRATASVTAGCDRCHHTIDPSTGLCDLHAAPLSCSAATVPALAPKEPAGADALPGRPVGFADTLEAVPGADEPAPAPPRSERSSSQRLRPPLGLRGGADATGQHADTPPPDDPIWRGDATAVARRLPAPAAELQQPAPSFASQQLLMRKLNGPEVVGRGAITEQLAAFLLGRATALELVGPEGLGKRSLLGRVGRAAQARGLTVMRLAPDPWGAQRPWYPVRRLVGDLLGHGPDTDDVAGLLGAARDLGLQGEDEPGLALLFGRRHPELASGRVARWRLLHRAGLRLIAAAASAHGAGSCVLVESPELYDRASADFLRLLARQSRFGRDKIVVAATTPQLPVLAEALVIPVGPLDPLDAQTLVERRAPGHLDPAALRSLLAAAAGNPLHLLQGVAALAEGGDASGTLAAVVRKRLGALAAEPRQLLAAVAGLGRRVPATLLAGLLPGHTLYLALGLLAQRGWLVDEPDGSVSVAHPTIGALVLAALPAHQRRGLYGRLLDLLEQSAASVFVRAPVAEAAGHFARATALYELAGDEAWRRMDGEGAALHHYRRAQHLAAWKLELPATDAHYLRLAYKQGSALLGTGHRLAAEGVLAEVVDAAEVHPGLARQAEEALRQSAPGASATTPGPPTGGARR